MPDLRVDAVVIGGGIAGMQSALDLADQDLQVALIEREPSIGGRMITLSKVFPTLDCCSCITTPKMSAVAHHLNIHLLTYCEVQAVERQSGGFDITVQQKPRYVDVSKCTGCRECGVCLPHHGSQLVRSGPRRVSVPYACHSRRPCHRKPCSIRSTACGAESASKPAPSRQSISHSNPRPFMSRPTPLWSPRAST